MKWKALVLTVLLCLPAAMARADVALDDVQVIAKSLGFLAAKPATPAKMAIVFAPDIAVSKAEADRLATMLGSGFKEGSLTLEPLLVPVAELEKLDGAGVVFVTTGLAAHQGAIFESAKSKRLLTVSTDSSCARTGHCVMSVASQPAVEILVNKQAADQSQVAFRAAFRMLIIEI